MPGSIGGARSGHVLCHGSDEFFRVSGHARSFLIFNSIVKSLMSRFSYVS